MTLDRTGVPGGLPAGVPTALPGRDGACEEDRRGDPGGGAGASVGDGGGTDRDSRHGDSLFALDVPAAVSISTSTVMARRSLAADVLSVDRYLPLRFRLRKELPKEPSLSSWPSVQSDVRRQSGADRICLSRPMSDVRRPTAAFLPMRGLL